MWDFFKRCGLIAALLSAAATALAEDVHVAVAANFSRPMQEIAADFEKATGNKLLLSFGSSGKLLEQIKHGAPFEAFLSADQARPVKVEQSELAAPGSRFTYAIGKLVLWSASPGVVDDNGEVLSKVDFKHLAIANPVTAPYGKAALETLDKLGIQEAVQAKIVQGDSIAQTREFVSSGNAELGFVALSQVIRDGRIAQGSSWLVPADLHSPIRQDVILLGKGERSSAARALMIYLQSEKARAVIESYGYGLPPAGNESAEQTADVR